MSIWTELVIDTVLRVVIAIIGAEALVECGTAVLQDGRDNQSAATAFHPARIQYAQPCHAGSLCQEATRH